MNVLIIGANGFTGRRLLETLSDKGEYNIYGMSLSADIAPSEGYKFLQSDMTNYESVKDIFKKIVPDVVINCAAISVPDFCENNKEIADSVNYHSVCKIADLCNLYGARFIQLSTDFVFDGQKSSPYTEEDIPKPVNYYGETKLLAEKYIAAYSNNYAIARVIVVYGKRYSGQHGNIVQLVYDKLSAGESINVVNDQWRSPLFVDDAAKAIESLVKTDKNGIFHLSGDDIASISEIAYKVATLMNLNSDLIKSVSTLEMQDKIKRPSYSALSNSKIKSDFLFQPVSLDEGILLTLGG